MKLFNSKSVPPEKPVHVTVSSIKTFHTCKRKFYWRYIRSIDSNYLYLPFYAGGIVHEGIEQFYKGKTKKQVINIIRKKIKEKSSKVIIRDEDKPKKIQQDALIEAALEAYMRVKHKEQKDWKIISSEKGYRMSLPGLKLKFRAALDLIAQRYRKSNNQRVRTLVDHKFQSIIPNTMDKGIHQNLQIQLYPMVYEACTEIPLHDAIFNVILKTKIRQKQSETFDDYIERMRAQYIEKESELFWRKQHKFKDKNMKDAFEALVYTAEEIEKIMSDAGDDFANERHWPKDTERCFDYYTTCPYFDLCKNGEYPQNTIFLGRVTEYYTGEIIDEPEIEEQKQKTYKVWPKIKAKIRPRK